MVRLGDVPSIEERVTAAAINRVNRSVWSFWRATERASCVDPILRRVLLW